MPFLRAVNQGPRPVLIFDGEELVGAKQNRIVNTTLLLGVGESLLPVSCVEQGRWSHRSESFAPASGPAIPNLRRQKELQVRENLRQADVHLEEVERAGAAAGHTVREARAAMPQDLKARAYRSDQGAVWSEVARGARAHGVSSRHRRHGRRVRPACRRPRTHARPVRQSGSRWPAAPRTLEGHGCGCGLRRWPLRLLGRVVAGSALRRTLAQTGPRLRPRGSAGGPFRPPATGARDAEADVLRLFAALAAARSSIVPGWTWGTTACRGPDGLRAGFAWDGELLQLRCSPDERPAVTPDRPCTHSNHSGLRRSRVPGLIANALTHGGFRPGSTASCTRATSSIAVLSLGCLEFDGALRHRGAGGQ